jgi:hypothetical protein
LEDEDIQNLLDTFPDNIKNEIYATKFTSQLVEISMDLVAHLESLDHPHTSHSLILLGKIKRDDLFSYGNQMIEPTP